MNNQYMLEAFLRDFNLGNATYNFKASIRNTIIDSYSRYFDGFIYHPKSLMNSTISHAKNVLFVAIIVDEYYDMIQSEILHEPV